MFKALEPLIPRALQSWHEPPELELLVHRPTEPRIETPVLFVHGAFAGAWCWEEHFLPYFAQQGITAYALSLRGHGRSGGHHALQLAGISDYVADVARIVETLERPPVLVGHSMGGLVVQKYLERHRVPGAVLMASVPPSGVAAASSRLMMGDPWLFAQLCLIQSMGLAALDLNTARRGLFSDDLPDDLAMRYAVSFQHESQRAIWDMTLSDLPRVTRIEVPPMLVLGGVRDTLFSPEMVEDTGRAYGVGAEIMPGLAHAMMLELRWQQAADRIIGWINDQNF